MPPIFWYLFFGTWYHTIAMKHSLHAPCTSFPNGTWYQNSGTISYKKLQIKKSIFMLISIYMNIDFYMICLILCLAKHVFAIPDFYKYSYLIGHTPLSQSASKTSNSSSKVSNFLSEDGMNLGCFSNNSSYCSFDIAS